MWNLLRTRRCRHIGTALLLLAIGGGLGARMAFAWNFDIAADFFAACAVGCFVLCVPLLLGPVGSTRRINVDRGSKEIAEACRILAPGGCQTEWFAEGPEGQIDADDISCDFGEGGFDCDFDVPFL